MKTIKKYSNFFNEKYFPDQSDSPESASAMNSFNDIEELIKEFEKSKTTIYNIYITYVDERDLVSKLSAQKFIDNTTDKRKIKFHNPLLGMWAQSCDKSRDLKDIDEQIKKWNQDISDEKSNVMANPSSKESVDGNIKLTQDKIGLKNQEISKISQEIMNLQKAVKDKLKAMRDELSLSKKRIDLYRLQKKG